MRFVCKIDRSLYSCITNDIITDEVIITSERISHIQERHPNDFERFYTYIPQILESPDYILADQPNTALILKCFIDSEHHERFRLVLRLQTSSDDPSFKNSIITFMKTNEKKWNQNLNNKKILYFREKT